MTSMHCLSAAKQQYFLSAQSAFLELANATKFMNSRNVDYQGLGRSYGGHGAVSAPAPGTQAPAQISTFEAMLPEPPGVLFLLYCRQLPSFQAAHCSTWQHQPVRAVHMLGRPGGLPSGRELPQLGRNSAACAKAAQHMYGQGRLPHCYSFSFGGKPGTVPGPVSIDPQRASKIDQPMQRANSQSMQGQQQAWRLAALGSKHSQGACRDWCWSDGDNLGIPPSSLVQPSPPGRLWCLASLLKGQCQYHATTGQEEEGQGMGIGLPVASQKSILEGSARAEPKIDMAVDYSAGMKSDSFQVEKVKAYRAQTDLDWGVVHIKRTRNNTIVTVCDRRGNAKLQTSGGCLGYSGSKEGSQFVGELVMQKIAQDALSKGFKKVDVRIKGLGSGKSQLIRHLAEHGLQIVSITDVTPIAFNGCRAKKRRRI